MDAVDCSANCPVRPLRIARNAEDTTPLETVAANADFVAKRGILTRDEIKKAVGRVHDNGANGILGAIEY